MVHSFSARKPACRSTSDGRGRLALALLVTRSHIHGPFTCGAVSGLCVLAHCPFVCPWGDATLPESRLVIRSLVPGTVGFPALFSVSTTP